MIQYSRTFAPQVQTIWNQAHAPLLLTSRAFQRLHGHDLKHPGSVDLVTTKQNKLPSFIDRSMDLQNQIHRKLMLTLDLELRLKSLEDNREICEVKETQYQYFEFDHEGVRLGKKQ
jgi:hypothetical protein